MAANALTNKQDIIAAIVQKELKNTASLLTTVSDFSSLAVKGSKTISIPKLSSFTVQNRSFGAALTENAALTDSSDTISLNKNKAILFGYDAADETQATINYKQMAISRAAAAHGRQFNTDIIAALTSGAGYNINGAVPADITNDNILTMRQFLLQNFVDMTKTVLVIAADQEKAMLKLPEFSRYEYRGNGAAPIVTGVIGYVYGVPVVINQQLPAKQAFMYDMDGIGFAFQRNPAVGEQDDVSYGSEGKKVVVDVLYGVAPLLLGEGVALDNSTALGSSVSGHIAKLAD